MKQKTHWISYIADTGNNHLGLHQGVESLPKECVIPTGVLVISYSRDTKGVDGV